MRLYARYVVTDGGSERRSLRYIRLAAHLAAQPPEVDRLTMTIPEIEAVIGASLPTGARYPAWWRNDRHRAHSRAWLSAGWRVEDLHDAQRVEFVRRQERVGGGSLLQ